MRDQALKFLEAFNNLHPGLLMFAIHPEKESPQNTRCFASPSATAAVEWGDKLNADGWIIYFHVNVADGVSKRPSKSDFTVLRALHVDADPPKGFLPNTDHYRQWAVETLARLEDLNPSFIVYSGRGLQAFWLMWQTIAASPKTIHGIEGANARLAHHMRTEDSTRDVSRLMKVPGFTAFPNAHKAEAGWQPQMAQLLGGDGRFKQDDELKEMLGKLDTREFIDKHPKQTPVANVPGIEKFLPEKLNPETGFPIPATQRLKELAEQALSKEQQAQVNKIRKRINGGKNARWVRDGVLENQKCEWADRNLHHDRADPSAIWGWMMYAAAELTEDLSVAYQALMNTGFVTKSCTPEGYASRSSKCECQLLRKWPELVAKQQIKNKEKQQRLDALLANLKGR